MDYRAEQVSFISGEPAEYASSEHVRRGFCGNCGSTLSFSDLRYPEYASLSIASLDDPNAITPESNVFLRERLHWVKFNEDMRNYDGFPE